MKTSVFRTCVSAAAFTAALTVSTPLRAADAADGPDQFDLGSDVTGYRRFLIYPHLQKGWESLRRGDRTRALAEFERARELAPENATVALHLAHAYRMFSDVNRAETVLRKQLERTPADGRVREALTRLRSPAPPDPQPMAATPQPSTSAALPPAAATAIATPKQAPAVRTPKRRPEVAVADNSTVYVDPTAAFTRALAARSFEEAQREAETLLARTEGTGAMLEEFSYRLVEAGAAKQAVRVLFTAYPFTSYPAAEREALVQRLLLIAGEQPAAVTAEDSVRLRTPLDTPALRSRQSVLWASQNDCDAVRETLGDMSSSYAYDDWMRLGDCSVTSGPDVALKAYATAHELRPGGVASRALAYQAYAKGDYGKAVGAWRSIGDSLSGEDLLAASTTALAASEHEQAAAWASRYRESGEPLEYRYWSLVAQINIARGDTNAGLAAYEQAVALQPNPDDYRRLAQLQYELPRQIRMLERAVAIDRNSATAQAELGDAYRRAGRNREAEAALRRAVSLDPDDTNAHLALGFLYWDTGRFLQARQALEKGYQTNRSRIAAAEQLVYVNQRLHANAKARWYAEQVLDATAASSPADAQAAAALSTRRFGLQRLHEDLGRRITVNFDGYTGTSLGTGTSGSQAGNRYSSYSQLEADARLGRQTIRDGSTLSAYARLIGDGGAERNALPSRNPMLGVGLRWKPWRNHIIYFSGENQLSLDNRDRREFLLRTSASFLNGGRFGDDWHASGRGWFSQNLYLDATHYVNADQSAATADYRNSYHVKLASGVSLEPYGHFQVSGLRTDHIARDVRFGVGSRWNVWYGASRYDAPPHKLSIGAEFQQAFETYLQDRNGLFLSVNSRW